MQITAHTTFAIRHRVHVIIRENSGYPGITAKWNNRRNQAITLTTKSRVLSRRPPLSAPTTAPPLGVNFQNR